MLANVRGRTYCQFIKCSHNGASIAGTSHKCIAITIFHSQLVAILHGDVPNTIVCIYHLVGLQCEAHTIAAQQRIIIKVLRTVCGFTYQVIITCLYILGFGDFNLQTIEEVLKVINHWGAIFAHYSMTFETLQECIQLFQLLRIILVFLLENLHLFVLMNTFDQSFEAYTGAIARIVAIGVARTKLAETAICQWMLVPVDPCPMQIATQIVGCCIKR